MEKQNVNSFDVFDTILGRLHTDSQSIFDIVEKGYPFPNFKNMRIYAEMHANGTLDGIYDCFQKIAQISKDEADKIKEFEITTELSQVYPIVKNIKMINDGDIIVSDSYYDEVTLMKILKQVGLNKTVKLFVTPHGKGSGKIWLELKKEYQILLHLGDNPQADVQNALLAGIPGKLFEGGYSELEQKVIYYSKGHKGLANLMRTLRLLNPFIEKTPFNEIWNEQAQINIPLLILSSLFLNDFCQKFNKNRILFSTRDCCHLFEIFRKLFDNYEAIYFCSSRYVYYHPTPEYIDYVKSVYSPQSAIVDGHGSGASCIDFFTKYFNTHPDYVAIISRMNHPNKITRISSNASDKFERINYDVRGSLINYTKEGPVWLDPEYDLQFIFPAHACIRLGTELIKQYQFTEFNQSLFEFFLYELERNICINKYVNHAYSHSPK